jgi:hypothetical protein
MFVLALKHYRRKASFKNFWQNAFKNFHFSHVSIFKKNILYVQLEILLRFIHSVIPIFIALNVQKVVPYKL